MKRQRRHRHRDPNLRARRGHRHHHRPAAVVVIVPDADGRRGRRTVATEEVVTERGPENNFRVTDQEPIGRTNERPERGEKQ